jgi:hypothetical protein
VDQTRHVSPLTVQLGTVLEQIASLQTRLVLLAAIGPTALALIVQGLNVNHASNLQLVAYQIVLLETAQVLIALQLTAPIKQTLPPVSLHVCRIAQPLNVLAVTAHCHSATQLVDS